LRCIKRDSGWVSRYEGEEFLICLPGAELKRVIEIAEDMRKKAENNVIVFGDYTIKSNPLNHIGNLIECTDKKPYTAKFSSRTLGLGVI